MEAEVYLRAQEVAGSNRQLARIAAQLESANQELESFSYSVSHDLRAPLRVIDGFSLALLEDYGPSLPAEGQDLLARMRRQAQRMARLIEDLLEFSRLGRKALDVAPVDLAALAQAVVQELVQANVDRKVEVTVAPLRPPWATAACCGQVLTNLIGNAFKFTRQRPDARVEIGSRDEGGERVYYVRDNGAGFDIRYANKLFGVFQRLHPAAEFEGTGVGLALVQRIIRRHGGRVWGEAPCERGGHVPFHPSMKTIRIDFCDFWPGFRKDDNRIYNLLKTRYAVELHDRPDFVDLFQLRRPSPAAFLHPHFFHGRIAPPGLLDV